MVTVTSTPLHPQGVHEPPQSTPVSSPFWTPSSHVGHAAHEPPQSPLRFHEITYEVTHMLSKDGEELHLVKEVGTRNTTVDSWLKLFESSMVLTVKDALFLTFE